MGSPQKSLSYPVYLRVYDISDGAAALWSPMLLGRKIRGIWHTGIVVFGMEYFYGGGIVKMKSTDVEASYGIHVAREHFLGTTLVSQREFETYLVSIKNGFTRDCYDLIRWNCNNFTDHASHYLTKRGIPSYILELPEELTQTFMGKLIINFIRMFSDAPAIDSNSADHPRQTLGLSTAELSSSSLSPSRRKSCPSGLSFKQTPRCSNITAVALAPPKSDPTKHGQRTLSVLEWKNLERLRDIRRTPLKVTFRVPPKDRNPQRNGDYLCRHQSEILCPLMQEDCCQRRITRRTNYITLNGSKNDNQSEIVQRARRRSTPSWKPPLLPLYRNQPPSKSSCATEAIARVRRGSVPADLYSSSWVGPKLYEPRTT